MGKCRKLEKGARCGRKFGGRCCGKGRYCSKWNWCGTSKLHKRTQQRRYSNWVLKKRHPNHKCRKLEKGARCGKQFGGRCCGKGRFCSKWNWCGTSKLHKSTKQRRYSNWVLKKRRPNHKCRKLEKGARCGKQFG